MMNTLTKFNMKLKSAEKKKNTMKKLLTEMIKRIYFVIKKQPVFMRLSLLKLMVIRWKTVRHQTSVSHQISVRPELMLKVRLSELL